MLRLLLPLILRMLLIPLTSQASQVYYNPETGVYEEKTSSYTITRQPESQPLYTTAQPKASSRKISSWILPSLSVYGGMSGYQTTSQATTYTDSTQVSTSKSIAGQSLTNGNIMLGAEFMFPISQNGKLGFGASHNFDTAIFNQTISSSQKKPFNLQLENSLYGKFSHKLNRISLNILGGMQFSKFSIYDSQARDVVTTSSTYTTPATYDLLGTFSAINPFLGLGGSYKLSPSTSLFLDGTYSLVTVSASNSSRTTLGKSSIYDTQITALTQGKEYGVFQVRFGFSFDFIGLTSSEEI